MIIKVCSQTEAMLLVSEAREKTAIISITSTGDEDLSFPDNPAVEAILHLKFNDLVSEVDEEGFPYGRPLPQFSDFNELKSFVDSLTCDRLIVHCWEGASRSAAVAQAVCEYRGNSNHLQHGSVFRPNPLVYSLACRALGIDQG